MTRFLSFLCLSLPLAIPANPNNYTPCNPCVGEASPEQLARMKLRFYTGQDLDDYTSVRIGNALELCDKIDRSKPTVAYVSGLGVIPEDQSVGAIISAYLARGDHNTLLLDHSDIIQRDLKFAASSVMGIGFTLATALDRLAKRCLNVSSLHIVGHDLGAQICGYAGRFVNYRIPRIIGLDPPVRTFSAPNAEDLTSSDAELVFIIHTNRDLFGTDLRSGHADFYPNNGVNPQPGCATGNTRDPLVENGCSHYRACFYYAESVRNENSFVGLACDSYCSFVAGSCNSSSTAVMGFGTRNNARGRYYLETNGSEPYGRRRAGEMCGQ